MAYKVLLLIPPSMLKEVDEMAKDAHRTRSDFLREAIREYVYSLKLKAKRLEEAEA